MRPYTADAVEPPERASRLPRLRGARLDIVLAIAITLFAGGLRFVRLDEPNSIIPLDETYYAVNAFGYLKHGVDMTCSNGNPAPVLHHGIPCPLKPAGKLDPAFAVHPPVGKWLIAGGIKVFGYNSFGYRAGAALFGTLSVLVLYMLARRLWRNPWIAALAAMLLGIDGLHFVQSRIAMLDIFLAFFVLLAVWLLVEDRERTPPNYRGIRGWRIGAGVSVGLALATKWSAMFVIPMMFVVALVWELDRLSRRRPAFGPPAAPDFAPGTEADPSPEALTEWQPDDLEARDATETFDEPQLPEVTKRFWRDLGNSLWTVVVKASKAAWAARWQIIWAAGSFVLIPLIVYVLSYASWFAAKPAEPVGQGGYRYTAPRCGDPDFTGYVSPVNTKVWNWDVWPASWRSWVCYQREIFDYHKNLKNFDAKGKPIHPYLTRAWSWPWIGRPTAHAFDSQGKGNPKQAEILGLPNPAVWFAAFFLALPLCAFWAIRRRDQIAALLLLLFAPFYVPWLVTSRPLFMFYMTPAVAFLILILCHLIHRALEEWSVEKQRILASALLVMPFTPLFIQWFSVPGFTIAIGTNVTPGPQSPATIALKVLAVAGTAVVVWAAVAILYTGRRPGRLLAVYAGFALVLFAYFYPVLASVHIPDTGSGKTGISQAVWQAYGWRSHMWLTADCRSQGIKIACWI
jgi:dolichyl-phosphate-mannose-protein mannosyltransferase/protein-O-mannosyltransferase-like protein